MRDSQGKNVRAGGSILALGIIAGTIVGVVFREPSIGFMAGAGLGLAIVGLIWLSDRRQTRSRSE